MNPQFLKSSLMSRHTEAASRLSHLRMSLNTLKYPDSDFATAHRVLIRLDEEILAVVDRFIADHLPATK